MIFPGREMRLTDNSLAIPRVLLPTLYKNGLKLAQITSPKSLKKSESLDCASDLLDLARD